MKRNWWSRRRKTIVGRIRSWVEKSEKKGFCIRKLIF
ncbi:hypothetical protein Pint_21595 [Pistacia integerrima]|uniref:Uncharacterized protein n=1 Tax=Pistacia integerrima TaxID=434235 RepID=A0ACC0X9S0_9ROSI|nr:hypothetical protein Pint_21595 [Pistacia integerrima]